MLTNDLLKLARAMAEFEGWHYPGLNSATLERGSLAWQNHNPGNLRASPFAVGVRDGFAFFVNDEVGFFAMVWDLWSKCSGRTSTGLTGESTLYDLIKIYSGDPPDVVVNYVRHVELRTAFSSQKKLKEFVK